MIEKHTLLRIPLPALLLWCILTVFPAATSAQGAIVNEISNGQSGSREFIELLVIGSAANPTGLVDLTGWIIDDNNGDFSGGGAGIGTASGHIRFTGGCFDSLVPGTLILIYNNAEPAANIPPDDPTDANADCIVVFPGNNACLESCSSPPTTTNASYAPCTYGTGVFTRMGLRNGGDAAQVRDPATNFFHGFSFGNVGAPFPSFPASIGGGSAFNVAVGNGGGNAYLFNCGSFTNAGNFSVIPASSHTPGDANNQQNIYVINAIRAGTYDYANLNAAGNCGTATSLDTTPCPLPFVSESLLAVPMNDQVRLTWEFDDHGSGDRAFEMERSIDGRSFVTFGKLDFVSAQKSYTGYDPAPNAANYYRVKRGSLDGHIAYSNVAFVEVASERATVVVAPNPTHGRLNLAFELPGLVGTEVACEVYNLQGRQVLHKNLAVRNSRFDSHLDIRAPAGIYMLEIRGGNALLHREKLVVMGD